MRRDYIDVDVRDEAGETDRPTVEITFDGPSGLLAEQLSTEEGTLESSDVDVTYRMTDGDESGVLSVANRHTGEYLLEANLQSDAILGLVKRVKGTDGDDDSSYSVRITDADGDATVYEKGTLLVYDADGSLRRQDSLIPGGVEL